MLMARWACPPRFCVRVEATPLRWICPGSRNILAGMTETLLSADKAASVAELAKNYVWWDAVDPNGHTLPRLIAQIMRLGTYDDILRLEGIADADVLAEVMRTSAPGWFDDRSWDFWRGRLSFSGQQGIPKQRPQRTFIGAPQL
jgi:hypothetical protein